jgi:eukaryotic translation initiation factor 2C
MCGVSYVSPTYYADRLCERGRLYIRSYFNGDDADFKKEYADAKDKKAAAQKKARQDKFGKEWHVKTNEERDMEKRDAAELSEHLKKLTNDKVKAAFYNQDSNSDGSGGWKNPYSYKLRNTMFWM